MKLWDILQPQTPPEPVGARVIHLWDEAPTTSQAKRDGNRRWDERNRERKAAAQRERYWRLKNAERAVTDGVSAVHCEDETV